MSEDILRAAGGAIALGNLLNPNKMPFSGVLTYLGVPSDLPPGGSGGRKVLIPVDVGQSALESLKGMPVNLAASMDDHDTNSVIGVIEDAEIGEVTAKGTPINVSGHIFAKSFPNEATAIKAAQQTLGFSYETAKTQLEAGIYNGESVAVVKSLVFTGAAILYKDAAAYQSTSLAAKGGAMEDLTKALLQAISDLKSYVDTRFDELRDMQQQDIDGDKAEEIAEDSGVMIATKGDSELSEENKDVKDEVITAAAVEEKAEDNGNGDLLAAIGKLTEVVQSLQEEIKAGKEEKKDEGDVSASVLDEPQRRSVGSAQLSAKFDKTVDGDVFASIDKKNLGTVSSMAEKLSAVFK